MLPWCLLRQWYFLGLKPWVHYIPLDYFFSNLIYIMEWAR